MACDPDALHQARRMAPADRDALPVQEVAQHPAAGKRVVEMQFVEAAHDPQILGRSWPGFVIDGAPADAERLGLPGDRQVVLTVDHRLALSNPALVSAPSKKSFSRRQLADLGVKRLQVDARRRLRLAPVRAEQASRPFQHLASPLRDLVRVHIEKLSQFGQRLVALHGSQRHLRLEARRVVPAGSLRHLCS